MLETLLADLHALVTFLQEIEPLLVKLVLAVVTIAALIRLGARLLRMG